MKHFQLTNPDCDVYVGESYQSLEKYLPDKQVVIITDTNVFAHYKDYISRFTYIRIPAGEKAKSWATVSRITKELLELGVDRQSFLIGFGGGVVCDLTGFVASIFMRGIPFAFVPTTLLAQVDACIGGKNGINFRQYKNMLGVFNTPDFIVCDPKFNHTLPKKELSSGFAEVIKHALISDKNLFSYLNENSEKLLSLSATNLTHIIYTSTEIKTSIVAADYREKNERKKLNFGHTLGHAIENNSRYTHGASIAVGMRFASQLSVKYDGLDLEEFTQIKLLLEKFNLPLTSNVSAKKIIQFVKKDKKKNRDDIDFILLENIGSAVVKKIKLILLEKEIKNNFR